jgi:hypothetical protein
MGASGHNDFSHPRSSYSDTTRSALKMYGEKLVHATVGFQPLHPQLGESRRVLMAREVGKGSEPHYPDATSCTPFLGPRSRLRGSGSE